MCAGALVLARIDRLDEEARSTLQMASVIGRSFYYSILKKISESAMALDKQLISLERLELVPPGGSSGYFASTTAGRVLREAAKADFEGTVTWRVALEQLALQLPRKVPHRLSCFELDVVQELAGGDPGPLAGPARGPGGCGG